MIYPNKHIKFEESIICKMLFILDAGVEEKINIHVLYKKVSRKYKNIDEFLYALDVLYVLDKIDIDYNNNEITYVEKYK